MSWWNNGITDFFQEAASAVGEAASYTATYAGATVAVVGGAVLDIGSGAIEGAASLAGYDVSLYEGSAAGAALEFIVDGSANELATYIHKNPGDAGQATLKGLEHGVAGAAGTVTGFVAGAGGLVVDAGNLAVSGAGNMIGQDWGYEGSAAINWFATTNSTVSGGIIQGADWAIAKAGFKDFAAMDIHSMTAEQQVLFSASKATTQVAADVAIVAATWGTGAALVAGARAGTASVMGATFANSASNVMMASATTPVGLGILGVDGGASTVSEVGQTRMAIIDRAGENFDLAFGS